jgi:hypothetical protein
MFNNPVGSILPMHVPFLYLHKYLLNHKWPIAIFWDVSQFCLLADVREELTTSITYHPEERGMNFIWNISQYLPDYTVTHPRRRPSSFLSLQEPQILLRLAYLILIWRKTLCNVFSPVCKYIWACHAFPLSETQIFSSLIFSLVQVLTKHHDEHINQTCFLVTEY